MIISTPHFYNGSCKGTIGLFFPIKYAPLLHPGHIFMLILEAEYNERLM